MNFSGNCIMKPRYLRILVLLFCFVFFIIFRLYAGIEEENEKNYNATFNRFVEWMHKNKYPQDLIDIYKCNYQDPMLKLIIRDYFKIKVGSLRHPHESRIGYNKFKNLKVLSVNFVEVVPTDKQISYSLVDANNIKNFEKYLSKLFGKKVAIKHDVIKLRYMDRFGDIFYSYEALFDPNNEMKLKEFMDEFEPPCIVRFDAESIGEIPVAQVWNTRRCAIFLGGDFRLEKRVFNRYAHEFGHNIGLDHQFVDPDNLPRENFNFREFKLNQGKYVGADDIMIKTNTLKGQKVGSTLSPLSRFVLEPNNSFEDKNTFGSEYAKNFSPGYFKRIKDCACQSGPRKTFF